MAGIAGCGQSVAGASTSTGPTPNTASYGVIYARITNQITENGHPGFVFGAQVFEPAPVTSPCASARATSGACCFVPAEPESHPEAGSGLSGLSPDGGPDARMTDLGTLSLTNATTNRPLVDDSYQRLQEGFGFALGYADCLLNDVAWRSGDLLELDAMSSDASPTASFQSSVDAVGMPDVKNPTSLSRATNLALRWTPDPNAQTATLTLQAYGPTPTGGSSARPSHGEIVCTVADSAGKVTVDASLLRRFDAGDTCWGGLERQNNKAVTLKGGQVTFAAQAFDTFIVPVK